MGLLLKGAVGERERGEGKVKRGRERRWRDVYLYLPMARNSPWTILGGCYYSFNIKLLHTKHCEFCDGCITLKFNLTVKFFVYKNLYNNCRQISMSDPTYRAPRPPSWLQGGRFVAGGIEGRVGKGLRNMERAGRGE